MSGILALLREMRGRLGTYIGASSIIRLAAFLRGYELAMEKLGDEVADPFLPAFRDWIHQRFQSSEHSWEDTILLHSADEADAMKRFWELLDIFVKEQQALPTTKALEINDSERIALGSRAREP